MRIEHDPGPQGPPRAPRWAALATALIGAADVEDCLARWALAVGPPADLLVLLDPRNLAPRRALRREDVKWVPLALPPVGLDVLPARTEELPLGSGRSSPLADLLHSLSLSQAMVVPLGENAGALVVARAGRAFSESEALACEQEAAWLAASLEHHRGRHREQEETGSARELSALFELNRSLARALGARELMDSARRCLVELLAPACGAIRLEAEGLEPAVVCWPEGELARRARARAAGSLAADPSLAWLTLPCAEDAVGVALGWQGSVPPPARRIAGAVQASLVLAAGRLAAQRRLEEDRLLRTMEGLPLGVALLTREGRLRLVNPAARRLLESFGAWPEAGGVLERLGSVELLPQIAAALAGRSTGAEVFFPEGRRVLELRLVPAVAGVEAEEAEEVVLVLDEVTEQRRQRQQLAQAEKLSAMGELIAGVVHEINNPLSTILGYAEMLGSADAPEVREQWIGTIVEEGRRCQRIVANMLSLARSHESEGELVCLGAIAEKALSLVAYPYRGAGIASSLRVSSDTPAVRVGADRLLQLLINLLTNALHALEEYDGDRKVRVEISPCGERVLLLVADSGPGIPEALWERVFEPFFTTKEEGKGTGLGLSQVAATVEDFGGSIEVGRSEEGGACFRILLPSAAEAPPAAAEPAAVEGIAAEGRLSGVRVLVIDDEPAVADCLTEFLRQAGATVEQVHQGADGLRRVLSDPLDLVICDLRMPRIDGSRILEAVCRRRPELIARMVFATGDPAALDEHSLVRQLDRPCLSKPFDFRIVLETACAVAGR